MKIRKGLVKGAGVVAIALAWTVQAWASSGEARGSGSTSSYACINAKDSAQSAATFACKQIPGSYLNLFETQGTQWWKNADGTYGCTVSYFYTCY